MFMTYLWYVRKACSGHVGRNGVVKVRAVTVRERVCVRQACDGGIGEVMVMVMAMVMVMVKEHVR